MDILAEVYKTCVLRSLSSASYSALQQINGEFVHDFYCKMEAKSSLRSDLNSFMCLDVNKIQDIIYNSLLPSWSLHLSGSFYFLSFLSTSPFCCYTVHIHLDCSMLRGAIILQLSK